MAGLEIQVRVIAWYKKENWAALMEVFEDRHKLHNTFEEWLKASEDLVQSLEARGVKIVKVDIDPVEFPVWCKSLGLNINDDARHRWVNEAAHRFTTGSH